MQRKSNPPRSGIVVWVVTVLWALCVSAAPSTERMGRGKGHYLRNCFICHQISGQGSPNTFPPLAKSDFLLADPKRAIRALCEGLSGRITVNGKPFDGTMPAAILNDEELADTLTYVLNSWENEAGEISAEEVKAVRAATQFPTFEDLVKANAFAPLPKPPEGFAIREVVRLTNHVSRLLPDLDGKSVLALGLSGDIWRLNTGNGAMARIVRAERYLEPRRGGPSTTGFCFDDSQRLYVTCNRRVDTKPYFTNEVTIYRSAPAAEGKPIELKPWFRMVYPWGIGPFNHGVAHIAKGPDGKLYVGSGSRTDGAEKGTDSRYSDQGETPETACMWRLDPKEEEPKLEVYARGLRNPYGFCWDAEGRLLVCDNGPDAHAPEELNVVVAGGHYGFPFQFSDWTNKPYAYTPDAPKGVVFKLPVANNGPAGGFQGKPLFTFDPHSSPAGIVALGDDFPPAYRGRLFVVRFGNMIERPSDAGFDLLQINLKSGGPTGHEAAIKTAMAPLARPLDIVQQGQGKLYLLEYSRPLTSKGSLGFPGRILELTAK